jgi:hypothetical protein
VRALYGEVDAGIAAIRHSIEVERSNVQAERYFFELAFVHFAGGDLDAAANAARRAMQRAADRPRNTLLYSACLGLANRADEARAAIAELLERTHGLTAVSAITPPFLAPDDVDRYREGLRRAGLPDK